MFHLSQNDGRCNMNSASSSLKSFSVTCASRAAFVADSCEERWFSVLPAEPHTNPPDHLLWHAELLLNQRAVSGAEKHIQFTALISLTQSIIQPSSHPAIQAAGQPFFLFLFWEHFRWVFGCEWALGMRFEEDYQGPESCLEASCAFQQNCHFPGCIRLWNIWCVTLSLPFLSLSHSLSGSDIEKHGCRAWRRYLGLLLPALHSLALQWYKLFLFCVAMTSSPLQFCRLSCASFTMTSYLLVLNCEKRVAGCCWPNYSCCWYFHLASTAAYSMLFSAVQRPRFPWLAMLWYRLIKVWYYKAQSMSLVVLLLRLKV